MINTREQQLVLKNDRDIVAQYLISTAKNGLGEKKNSFQTPRGWHCVRAKIGANMPLLSVFQARRWTCEIYSSALSAQFPDRDWILTRILWLSGLEIGKNRLGDVDTMQRYIYIHGTADEHTLGIAHSHGCIRMRNQDIVDLFNRVILGERIWIGETDAISTLV